MSLSSRCALHGQCTCMPIHSVHKHGQMLPVPEDGPGQKTVGTAMTHFHLVLPTQYQLLAQMLPTQFELLLLIWP